MPATALSPHDEHPHRTPPVVDEQPSRRELASLACAQLEQRAGHDAVSIGVGAAENSRQDKELGNGHASRVSGLGHRVISGDLVGSRGVGSPRESFSAEVAPAVGRGGDASRPLSPSRDLRPESKASPPAPSAPAALTIGHVHRTAMRRIDRGEPVGDLGELLGVLYFHDLVRDDEAGRPTLSDDGRKVLAAHDALADTRRLERPRLEPRPAPDRWTVAPDDVDNNAGVQRYEHTEVRCMVRFIGDQVAPVWIGSSCSYWMSDDTARRVMTDVLALIDWSAHQRAVAAQQPEATRP